MMSEIRSFIVYGRPQAKQRPRLYRGTAYTPEATKQYELRMRNAYVEKYGDYEPMEGDLYLEVKAYFNKKNHGDLDNIIKCIDGCNKVAFKDDKQIKEIHGYLIVDKKEEERLEILIAPLNSQKRT
jgi:Holliday junction resolvase RusA-like endonuclease